MAKNIGTEKKANLHREVTPEGWALDKDHWYTRRMHDGDLECDVARFGFTHRGRVYLRRAEQCFDYDRGEVPQD